MREPVTVISSRAPSGCCWAWATSALIPEMMAARADMIKGVREMLELGLMFIFYYSPVWQSFVCAKKILKRSGLPLALWFT
jgi:hypothetical protein